MQGICFRNLRTKIMFNSYMPIHHKFSHLPFVTNPKSKLLLLFAQFLPSTLSYLQILFPQSKQNTK